ncbi:hypothetical protein ACFVFQ_37540, partial [Streptomyces sp. NPDC057743]|uniref:hypothetical protein n=1 Tax=Streptomyces sp. NPDC057743 TaxID=3346236 RepID=UPI003681527E
KPTANGTTPPPQQRLDLHQHPINQELQLPWQITDLCVMTHERVRDGSERRWPPILGLFKSVVVALTYMRRNHVQQQGPAYRHGT